MKADYKQLMDKMGVGRMLHPYETQPWILYDETAGITCAAEVRCNFDTTEIEAEMQFMYDTPPEGKAPLEQICLIRAQQQKRLNGDYTITDTWIRGESWVNKLYDWESKSCGFFRALLREVKAGKIPDVDAVLSKEMKGGDFFSSGHGDGSNRSQKINTGNLLYDLKGKGRGF